MAISIDPNKVVLDNNDIDPSQVELNEPEPTQSPSGTFNLSASKYFNPEQIESTRDRHPFLSKVPSSFPIIGGIIGSLAGAPTGGLASAGLAGLGAMSGEELKQLVEMLSRQRKKADWGEVAREGLFSAGGEGVGQGLGKFFEMTQPALAQSMANIDKADFVRILENIKAGKKVFPKNGLQEAMENLNKVASEANPENAVPIQNINAGIDEVLDYFKGANINPTKEALKPELENIAKQIESSAMGSPENMELYRSLINDYGQETADTMMSAMGKEAPTEANFYDIHRLKQSLGDEIKDFDKYKGQKMQALKGIYGSLNKNLNEANPLYQQANEAMKDRLAEQSFRGVVPRYASYYAGKQVNNANIAGLANLVGAGGGAYGYATTHNPLSFLPELALVLQMSPTVQGDLLKIYNALYKTKLGGGAGALLDNILSPSKIEQSRY